MTVRYIPSYWNEPAFDFFCDPTAPIGAGTGTGTAVDPWTDVKSAINTHLASNKKLGIRTGRMTDYGTAPNNDLNHTANLTNLSAKVNCTIAAWRPPGAPDWPSIFTTVFKFGTSAAEWEEVRIGTTKNEVVGNVSTPGVYTIRGAAAAGSHIWHFLGTINNAQFIGGLSIGARYNMETIVTPATYKQHGPGAPGVECAWLEDKSGGSGDIIVNPSDAERTPLTEDQNYCQTDNGGLVLCSDANPADRGGVYAYVQGVGMLGITDCQDITLHYPFQVLGCGKLLSLKNTVDQTMTVDIRGLWGTHVGQVLQVSTDNLAPDFVPVDGTLAGTGSVDMSAGTNRSVFGDGSQPWITGEISEIDIDYVYSYALTFRGWVKNLKVHNIKADMCNLSSAGVFSQFPANAPMGSHNEVYDFYLKRIHCGAGKFGRTDFGACCAEACGSLSYHHGVIEQSVGTFQVDGARRNQTVHHVLCKEVLQGPLITDEQDDGNGSHQVSHVGVILDDPNSWRIRNYDISTAQTRWDRAVAFTIGPDTAYIPKGHKNDTDIMSKNDGTQHNGNWWMLGNCPPNLAYGVQNASIGAAAKNGPWDTTGVSDGAGGEISKNGGSVVIGQHQTRGVVLSAINGISHDPASIPGQRIVDTLYADASGTQTVTNGTAAAQVIDANGFLSPSSPATLRTGALILNKVNVPVTIPYIRVAHNEDDLRHVPRWGAVTSLGPNQWIALSSQGRSL